jgi:ERCC4-type nuclease
MILVDPRIGSRELLSTIRQQNVPAELADLAYGDCCFEGKWLGRNISIGVERKRLHDMLHCIDDARYSAHQLPGMNMLYEKSILIVEGAWKPHEDGTLMEGFPNGSWGPCRYRSRPVLYAKLRRYLLSVSLSGVTVTFSRNLLQTAIDVCEMYHYFQKDKHTALLQTQKLNLPSLNGKPSLTKRWAAEIDDIGVELSDRAEQLFGTPIALAEASVVDWQSLKGIGYPTASRIVKQIQGVR